MTNFEKIRDSKEVYSPQAKLIIENLKEDFPVEEFEAWVRKEKFQIGGGHIVEFLELRQKVSHNVIADLTNLPNV